MEYEVESIKGKRLKNNKTEYLIKWVGFSQAQNTWEPFSNLSGARDIVNQFNASRKPKNKPSSKKVPLPNRRNKKRNQTFDSEPQSEKVSIFDDEEEDEKSANSGCNETEQNYGNVFIESDSKQNETVCQNQNIGRHNIKVSGVTEQNGELLYLVESHSKKFWVKKHYFVPDNLSSLLKFYEDHIIFNDKNK